MDASKIWESVRRGCRGGMIFSFSYSSSSSSSIWFGLVSLVISKIKSVTVSWRWKEQHFEDEYEDDWRLGR
jgi:hypothetical protein